MHPDLGGHVAIINEDDPYLFVDGDDVLDPETGTPNPVFVEILERLGLSYGDVTVSETGSHILYEGELPEGVKQAAFEIDDEP